MALEPTAKLYDMAILVEREIRLLLKFYDFVFTGEVIYLAFTVRRVFPQDIAPWLGDLMKRHIWLSDVGQFCNEAFLLLPVLPF